MKQKYKILLVDAGTSTESIILQELSKMNLEFTIQCVSSRESFLCALDTFDPDVIISDEYLPEFDAFSAMRILRERGADIPFLLAAFMPEEQAVDYLRWGAFDYVLKSNLLRLPFAVKNALLKCTLIRERKSMESVKFHLHQPFQATAGMN